MNHRCIASMPVAFMMHHTKRADVRSFHLAFSV
jgi:hypothetical protein